MSTAIKVMSDTLDMKLDGKTRNVKKFVHLKKVNTDFYLSLYYYCDEDLVGWLVSCVCQSNGIGIVTKIKDLRLLLNAVVSNWLYKDTTNYCYCVLCRQ